MYSPIKCLLTFAADDIFTASLLNEGFNIYRIQKTHRLQVVRLSALNKGDCQRYMYSPIKCLLKFAPHDIFTASLLNEGFNIYRIQKTHRLQVVRLSALNKGDCQRYMYSPIKCLLTFAPHDIFTASPLNEGLSVGFLLLHYSVLFTIQSLSLLYHLVIS